MEDAGSVLESGQSSVVPAFDELAVIGVIGQRVFMFAVQVELHAVVRPGVGGIVLKVGIQYLVSDIEVIIVP